MPKVDPPPAVVILRDLDVQARPAAALRAVAALPDTLRGHGARANLFTAAAILAHDDRAKARAAAGLARAIETIGVIREVYATRERAAGQALHPQVRAVLDRTVPGHPELVEAIDAFRATAQDAADAMARPTPLDRAHFDDSVEMSFSRFLPVMSDLMDRTDAVVRDIRTRDEAAADAARVAGLGACQRIDRLTRSVRMIAINARIEAARAGEAGRTFNVIAEEIRTLTDQVEAARAEIRTSIEDIMDRFRAT